MRRRGKGRRGGRGGRGRGEYWDRGHARGESEGVSEYGAQGNGGSEEEEEEGKGTRRKRRRRRKKRRRRSLRMTRTSGSEWPPLRGTPWANPTSCASPRGATSLRTAPGQLLSAAA